MNFLLNYRLILYTGFAFLSNLGVWMRNLALSYYLYDITNKPIILGILAAIHIAPRIFMGTISGIIVDRHGEKIVICLCNTFMAAVALVLFLLTKNHYSHEVIWICSVVLCGSILNNLVVAAWPIFVRNLVKEKDKNNALFINSSQLNIARVIAPLIAGFLMEHLSINIIFLINAFTYIPIIIFISFYLCEKKNISHTSPHEELSLPNLIKLIYTRKIIFILFAFTSSISFFAFPLSHFMPIYAKFLHLGPSGLGFLLSAFSLGGVLSFGYSITARFLSDSKNLIISAFSLPLMLIIMSFINSLNVILVCLFIFGLFNVAATNLLMISIIKFFPEKKRGTAIGLYHTAFSTFLSLGAISASIALHFISLPKIYFLQGLLLLALSCLCYFYAKNDLLQQH